MPSAHAGTGVKVGAKGGFVMSAFWGSKNDR